MSTPNNTRAPLTDDLDRCAFHPDRETVGWRDITTEGVGKSTIGVCFDCAATIGGDSEEGRLVPIASGAPCLCGPGFCAHDRGLGHVGFCGGSRNTAAPDCARCGAPHQSDAGCWLCLPNAEPWECENTAAYLRMLAADVRGPEVMDYQDAEVRAGRFPTFAEAADAVIAKKAAS